MSNENSNPFGCFAFEVEAKPKTYRFCKDGSTTVKKNEIDKLCGGFCGLFCMYSLEPKTDEFEKLVIERMESLAENAKKRYAEANDYVEMARVNNCVYAELEQPK